MRDQLDFFQPSPRDLLWDYKILRDRRAKQYSMPRHMIRDHILWPRNPTRPMPPHVREWRASRWRCWASRYGKANLWVNCLRPQYTTQAARRMWRLERQRIAMHEAHRR